MSRATLLLLFPVLLPLLPSFHPAQEEEPVETPAADERSPDEVAVESAALAYVEAFYERRPEALEEVLHPEVTRLGYFRADAESPYRESTLGYAELYDLAAYMNQSGWIPADAPRDVVVYDVLDRTATARCLAAWGVDFLHLARGEEGWRIVQVLWQSMPPGS